MAGQLPGGCEIVTGTVYDVTKLPEIISVDDHVVEPPDLWVGRTGLSREEQYELARGNASPECGLTWALPRAVGPAVASDIIVSDRRIGAHSAVAPWNREPDRAGRRPRHGRGRGRGRLSDIPAVTLVATKKLLIASPARTLSEQLADEARTIGDVGDHPEARARMREFLSRRTR
jgi:enoyl-CoA hydratase/carnithine racemase